MPDLAAIVQAGASNPWLYLPLAVVLGALHALEPGHAKSVMAAFIIAIRGTVGQAALLGLSAAIGHTIVIWALAAVGLWLGDKLVLDKAEPWLVLASGVLIIILALRLLLKARSASNEHAAAHAHSHDHGHHQDDDHDDGHGHHHASPGEIRRDYGGRAVSAWEIIWFGFTGGLMPCPSALAVLLACIQFKAFGLGFAMVGAFSVGLAATLVGIGVAAAWAAGAATKRFSGFNAAASWMPIVSAAIVLVIGGAITLNGLWSTGLI